MRKGSKFSRAQSAMEYLMTYGWAILIIAVVLGALFQLGVFNSGALLGTSCVAGPGYLCSSPVLDTNGNVMITFGQSTGATIYNLGMGCASTTLSNGLPNPAASIVFLGPTGAATANTAIPTFNGVLSLQNGQTVSISNVKCFSSTGSALASPAIGTAFSGGLWINYSMISSGVLTVLGGANPVLTAKVATLTMKVA